MINNISIKELLKIKNANIIDIRSIEKYNDNHIDNAKNIPYQLLLQNPSKYLNYNEIYFIYCQKGINSKEVVKRLNIKGYKTVNIIGGYENWLLEK